MPKYVPSEFGICLTIPLLKNESLDSSIMDNYRAITLNPVVYKIFEHCLLSQFNDYLVTSKLQCGFKPSVGCNKALAMFCDTVQYFTCNGSTVSVVALDMAKAFDKVNYCALFLKLMSCGVPPCLISLLFDWYDKIYTCVKWNNIVNRSLYNLLPELDKEVFSPVYFFTVHVNDIICKLEVSGYGCRIAGKYVGILMYADDLLLISA